MSKRLSYKEYLEELDKFDTWQNVGNSDEDISPLQKLSQFSRDYPKVYSRYREAMRLEVEKKYFERERMLNEAEFL